MIPNALYVYPCFTNSVANINIINCNCRVFSKLNMNVCRLEMSLASLPSRHYINIAAETTCKMGTRHTPLSMGSSAYFMQLYVFQKCAVFMQVLCEWYVSLLLWPQSLITSLCLRNLQNLDILWAACFLVMCHTCLSQRQTISITNKFYYQQIVQQISLIYMNSRLLQPVLFISYSWDM